MSRLNATSLTMYQWLIGLLASAKAAMVKQQDGKRMYARRMCIHIFVIFSHIKCTYDCTCICISDFLWNAYMLIICAFIFFSNFFTLNACMAHACVFSPECLHYVTLSPKVLFLHPKLRPIMTSLRKFGGYHWICFFLSRWLYIVQIKSLQSRLGLGCTNSIGFTVVM